MLVATPIHKKATEWNEYTGRLDATESVEVRPRVTGYIDAINFKEGQTVEQGAVLVQIDPRPYAADEAQAEGKLGQAIAAQRLADANLARTRDLLQKRAVSQQEYDINASQEQQAVANVVAAQAEVDSAKLQLSFAKVLAPISGVVGRQLVTRGNLINSNTTLLTTIVPQNPMYVYFEADEAAFLAGVRRYFKGETPGRGKGSVPIEMQLGDETGYPHKGVVNFVDNRLDKNTNTMELRGVFQNDDGLFTPGLFARVRIPASLEFDGLFIPDEAVASDQSIRYVWVVNAEGKADRRQIKVGPILDGLRLVREGLKPEDRVVIRGVQFVRPGEPLQVETIQLAADGATAPANAPRVMQGAENTASR